MSLQIEAYHDESAFDTLRDEWNALVFSNPRNRIFVTWQWQVNWWAAYHPGELWIIAVRDENGQLVGLAPWFIEQRPTERVVRSVGCVEVTDYLELIIRPEHEQAVLQTLADYLDTENARYDLVDFCNIPGDSPVLELWPPLLDAQGFSVNVAQQEVSPVITLPETWDGYLEQLDKKYRHELRRKIRRMRGAGEVNWYYIDEEHDLATAMERFLKLMRASSAEKGIFLDDPENVDFFNRVVPAMANCGWLKLSFLEIDGQDAAAYLSFDFGNQILLYNSGHDGNLQGSPGIVLLAYIIEDAIQQKREKFDFLRGNEDYKYHMGGQDTRVMMLSATK